MVFVEVDQTPVAYARVGWFPESSGDHIYYGLCWVHPEWRKKGIGTALLLNNERRIQEIAREHSTDGKKYYQNDFSDKQPGVEKLLLEHGYQPVRWGYEMKRGIDDPLPHAPMPEGIEVRKPNGDNEFRAIFKAENEAFRDHWGHVEPTEESYQRWLTQPNFNPDLWKVAWDGDRVAGMVLNFLNEEENQASDRKRGYTEDIAVLEPYRRKGLARSLLVQSIEMFREMGMEETALGVDTQNRNHALNLYHSVRYKVALKNTVVRKPLLEED
jgi:ribosomal protein S18 acetylase RimI-like enzyme